MLFLFFPKCFLFHSTLVTSPSIATCFGLIHKFSYFIRRLLEDDRDIYVHRIGIAATLA